MSETGSRDELHGLAARLTTVHGEGLFPAMAQYLGTMLHAEEVLIGEAVDEHHAQALGVSIDGSVRPNYRFPLAGTPYDALLRSESEDAPEPSPTDGIAAITTGDSGYLGMPLLGPAGDAVGFVCARSSAGLPITEQQHCLIEIVAMLLSAELQLLRSQRRCAELDAEVHRLRGQIDAMERHEVSAAASGRFPALTAAPPIDLDDTTATGLHHVQREHILRVLDATRWVIEGNSGAALKLGMKPATLRHRMKKLGIARAQRQA